jgi:hypothetical protein
MADKPFLISHIPPSRDHEIARSRGKMDYSAKIKRFCKYFVMLLRILFMKNKNCKRVLYNGTEKQYYENWLFRWKKSN